MIALTTDRSVDDTEHTDPRRASLVDEAPVVHAIDEDEDEFEDDWLEDDDDDDDDFEDDEDFEDDDFEDDEGFEEDEFAEDDEDDTL